MAKASAKDKPEEAASTTTSKSKTHATAAGSASRGRKPAGNGKESSVAQNNSSNAVSLQQASGQASSINSAIVSPWSNAPLNVLHSYRSFHRLQTPASFYNPHSHHYLTSGIGRQSPTAAGIVKEKRRVHREGLAMAVRKHFNASVVNENDAIVNTLYKARTPEKSLRLKFLPPSKQR